MSKKIMRYSILRYTPVKAAGEFINLGVLFVDENDGRLQFSYIKKMKRLAAFDDELDINGVRRLLKSINNDANEKMDERDFVLDEFIQYYLNGFVFSKPKNIVYDDFSEMVKMLEKTFLRFDYEKHERLSKESEQKIFRQLCKAQKVKIKSGYETKGQFDEKVKYDFATNDYYIKIFDYSERKNLSYAINSAKLWAWNACHADKKLIIIYRYDEQNYTTNNEFVSIMKIFESANVQTFDVLQMDEVISMVS